MPKPFHTLIVVSLLGWCTGCATTHSLQRLSLDMTKGEVIKKVGSPTVVRGAIKNKYGETVEVWEYNLSVPPTNDQWVWSAATFGFGLPFALSQQEPYWLYFVNEKLVRWGKAGDWKREADHIYEIRFGSDQGVATQ